VRGIFSNDFSLKSKNEHKKAKKNNISFWKDADFTKAKLF
jgi:hypothetical protein